MADERAQATQISIGAARLLIGLGQGVFLFLLDEMRGDAFASARELFAALQVVALFVPLILIGGMGALRPVTLALWALAATAVLAGLSWYDVWRVGETQRGGSFSFSVFFASAVLVFVGHHLVAAGDEARRLIAPYERYFDLGWRNGAQLALAGLFVGAFWAVLYLGAALFDLVKVTALRELIQKTGFALPATTTMFAAAIHVTALQSGLVRGFRALGLVLLSWLAPVMTLLAGAFLLLLPFTGLQPLWDTNAATAIMLGACVALVVLINATYQDGAAEHGPGWLRALAVRVAAVLLTPLAGLAAYALSLRIEQYGLTPERIYVAAVLLVGSCYALSYLVGAFSKRWMRQLETGNIVSAFAIMAVCLAIFSPIADPVRLSVDDQMRRFASGKVTAEQLDLAFLRFEGGRFGRAALERLRGGGEAEMARRAGEALAAKVRWRYEQEGLALPVEIRTHPQGMGLPQAFLDSEHVSVWFCRDTGCDAFMIDVDGDGGEEIILAGRHQLMVHKLTANGDWRPLGYVEDGPPGRLQDGDVRAVPARLSDLEIGGRRYSLVPVEQHGVPEAVAP